MKFMREAFVRVWRDTRFPRWQQSRTRDKLRLLQHEQLELAAEELRLAHDALGEITGRLSADDMLGHIFSTFCIGK